MKKVRLVEDDYPLVKSRKKREKKKIILKIDARGVVAAWTEDTTYYHGSVVINGVSYHVDSTDRSGNGIFDGRPTDVIYKVLADKFPNISEDKRSDMFDFIAETIYAKDRFTLYSDKSYKHHSSESGQVENGVI